MDLSRPVLPAPIGREFRVDSSPNSVNVPLVFYELVRSCCWINFHSGLLVDCHGADIATRNGNEADDGHTLDGGRCTNDACLPGGNLCANDGFSCGARCKSRGRCHANMYRRFAFSYSVDSVEEKAGERRK